MQKSLKKSFFKNKSAPTDKTPTPDPPSLTSDPAADNNTLEHSQNHSSSGDTNTSCEQASRDHNQGSHDQQVSNRVSGKPGEGETEENGVTEEGEREENGVAKEEEMEEEKMEEVVEENSDKAAKLSSAEKLASFAFKATS